MKTKEFVVVLFISILLLLFVYAIVEMPELQGNHDTTVKKKGNHDTTVAVRKELCEAVIADRFGDPLEGDNQGVKMHTIAGENGEVVAKVIIMYKKFPIVIKLEEGK